MPVRQDISGQRFGRLTVVEWSHRDQHYHNHWRCRCVCGNEAVVNVSRLRNGHTRSCGCLHVEHLNRDQVMDLTGQRFGRLSVISFSHIDGCSHWKCVCDCNSECVVSIGSLRNGNTQSCGCLQRDRMSAAAKKHGMSKTPIYRSWSGMFTRCYNKNNPKYEEYGGRGIYVCDRWHKSFENFYEDMGPRPEGCTLDRYPDNDGPYAPSNCRWATLSEQKINQRKRRSKEEIRESLR